MSPASLRTACCAWDTRRCWPSHICCAARCRRPASIRRPCPPSADGSSRAKDDERDVGRCGSRRGDASAKEHGASASLYCGGDSWDARCHDNVKDFTLDQTTHSTQTQHAALARMQQFMSASPVPSISTELLSMADGELNRELNHFLFDP